jgi:hypothetical protein
MTDTENETEDISKLQWILSVAFALFVHALFAVIGLLGALVIHAMFRAWQSGEAGTGEAIGIGLFGLLMAIIGFGFFFVAYLGAPQFPGGLERTREKYRDRPWLINRQWRARRIVHSTRYTAWFMWFWCIIWWGILGFFMTVNGDLIMADLRGSWGQAIPTSMPFAAGIVGLLVAISLSWQRWRYGDAALTLETLPGYLGGDFRGTVTARLAGRPNEPIRITLKCGSLTSEQVTGSDGSETRWITDNLWTRQQQLHPSQTIFSRGRIAIPIHFDLPSDLPESGHILDDPQITWRLEVSPGAVPDRALACSFDIPVFRKRGTV